MKILTKIKCLLDIHIWKEFGESNKPFEDKVFYYKNCNRLGYPKRK